MSSDYYKTLGVDKRATKAEIKKAYRAKAQQHHPDKGGDEKEFKKINEAYETLSDDTKRTQYDQFGATGVKNGSNGFSGFGGGEGFSGFSTGGFGGFEDVFSSFFGGGQRSGNQAQTKHGGDLEVEIELDFDESIRGTKKTFTSRNYEPCDKCGSKGGSGKKACATCHGQGSVSQKFQTPFGVVAQQGVCPDCKGEGHSFEETCSHCKGEGRTEGKNKIEIDIPSGVESGSTLRFKSKGEAGRRGGSRGDLYVHVRVSPSRKFERHGLDLVSTLKISVFDAILGGKFKVETFWGEGIVTVPENTRDGQLLRIRGKGVRSSGRTGDHIVHIKYEMPKKVSSRLKELLEQIKRI